MHRITINALIFLIAAFTGLTEPRAAEAAEPKPNIIFILADDYGIPGVGCYGGAYKTPNLDALAAGGMRFESCYSAPLCGPSRAMCMTGRYAFRTGVDDNGNGPKATPQREFSIAKVLKKAGYATAVAGKWRQLSHFTTKEDGQAWGFDEFLIWGVEIQKGERYWDPAYNRNGQFLTDTKGKYGPDLLHDFVVDFIRQHRDGPFFVYYPMPLIHGPILRTPDSRESGADHYADNIAYMDKLVGKLIAELEQLKLREKTLVVFTGDNGSTGQQTIHGRKVDGKKGTMQEGGSRVPLIASWAGTTPAGAMRKDLVDFSDFFPTFVEVAGAKMPEGVTIDGHSFAGQLRGQPGQTREWVYVHLRNKRYVRDARWKLNNDGEFFDMKDAPFTEMPVPANTADAEAQAARKKLQPVLDNLLAQDQSKSEAPSPKKKGRLKRLEKQQKAQEK